MKENLLVNKIQIYWRKNKIKGFNCLFYFKIYYYQNNKIIKDRCDKINEEFYIA